MKRFNQKFLVICLAIASLLLGIAADRFVPFLKTTDTANISKIRIKDTPYRFVKPLLGFDLIGSKNQFTELKGLQASLARVAQDYSAKDPSAKIGVYFRDLDTGHWTGFNETATFKPRSLLKIPLLIAYLKTAETDPELLSKQLTYRGQDLNDSENIKATQSITAGQPYGVEELLRRAIVFSDNNAAIALLNYIGQNAADQIYADLDIAFPEDKTAEDYLSPQQYSLFLRILFNSTYLVPEMSEKALKWMTEVEFKDGLIAGVPKNIPVAHKFGERSGLSAAGQPEYELHDCGIIYAPDFPYALCVMSRGENQKGLANLIQKISQTVYSEAQSFKK